MQFVSRIVMGVLAQPSLSSPFQVAKARMLAVIATPSPQPVLSPMYRFVNARRKPSKLPTATARIVSCGTSSPRYTLAYHSASSISSTWSGPSSSGALASASSRVRGAR